MSSFGPSVVSPTQAMSQQASPSPTSQSHPNAEGSVYAHQKWNVASQQPQLYLARLPPVAPASDSNSARSIQLGVPRPKRKRITPEQLEVLSNLFEYTDTPTFDLREAIGAKLGMSNREVQVWFQNRRAKVNRQRAPPTTQGTLQDRPVPSTSQQDPVRSSHGRLKSSSSELLLPSVSSLLQSSTDASSPTLSSAPLLPPFQPSVPGVSSIPDALGRPRRSQLATGSSSPRDIHGSDRPPQRPELQLRSPSGSHRRNNPNPPGSPYSRKWFPRRVPDGASHDRSACALSPRRSSTDPQPQSAILPDYLAAHHPARPRWSSPQETGSRDNLHATSHHAGFQHLNTIGPMPLDHSRQSDPAVTVNYHSMNVVPREREDNLEPSSASFARDFPSNNNQMSCSETNSSPRSISPPSHGPPAQNRQTWHSRGESMPSNELPPALRESRQESAEHGSLNLCCPPQHPSSFHQAKRSLSAEQPTSATPRSLFSSRYLPPLPNPVRPGPGSFPPPAALRVVPIRRGNVPPGHSSLSSSPSGSGFRLPPLLNDRPPENDLLIPPCHPSQSR